MLDFTNQYSISAWFYPTVIQGNQRTIISKAKNTTQTGLCLNLDPFQNYDLICDNTDGNGPHLINSNFSPLINNWYHGVVTYDGKTLKIYVNDTLLNSIDTTINLLKSTHDLTIGTQEIGLTDFFEGKIDDIRLYNRALTICDIDSLYHLTSDSATGISNFKSDNFNIQIFPNPSSGLFNLQITTQRNEKAELIITDIVGRVISSEMMEINQGVNNKEITQSFPGAYFITIKTDSGQQTEKMIIIQ